MFIYFRYHLFIIFSVTWINGIKAQTQISAESQLNPVIISATRITQPLQNALPSTSLITQEIIQNTQALDLPDLLRHEAGIQISQNGGIGTLSKIQIRGSNSTQVLILLDGIEIDSLSNGQTQLEHIMLNQIESIEIIRGNVSALYGSKAMGGVIRISTFNSRKANHKIALNLGVNQSHGIQMNYSNKLTNATTFNTNFSRQLSNSFAPLNAKQIPQANQQDHGYQNTSATIQLHHHLNHHWQSEIRFFQSQATTHFASAYGAPTDINYAHSKLSTFSATLTGLIHQQWQTHLTLANSHDINNSYQLNNLNLKTYASNFHTINHKLSWQNEIILNTQSNHSKTILLGYEYWIQKLATTAYQAPKRTIHAAFLGYQSHSNKKQLQMNIRHDCYSDFGYANSYFIGYGYYFTPLFKGYINMSNAFRAPSFNDLYFPNYSNLELQPEQAYSMELGFQYAKLSQIARLSIFRTDYKNLIDYRITDFNHYYSKPFNIGRTRIQGIEATITTQFSGLDIRVSATLQIPKNQIDNTFLKGRAHYLGNLQVIKQWYPIQLGAALQINGARIDSFTDRRLSGYSVFDLTVHYRTQKNWALSAKLANAFDSQYQTIYGYNTPRRGIYFALVWQPTAPLPSSKLQ